MTRILLLMIFAPIAMAEEPRWGMVRYDLNRMEYVIPQCEQSKIKSRTFGREGKRLVLRLECEPVPGEINSPNPDLYKHTIP